MITNLPSNKHNEASLQITKVNNFWGFYIDFHELEVDSVLNQLPFLIKYRSIFFYKLWLPRVNFVYNKKVKISFKEGEGRKLNVNEGTSKHLPFKKKCLLRTWILWEHSYHYFYRLRLGHVDDLLYYKVKTYRGSKLFLNEGECLNRGDLIIELHFNNQMLFKNVLEAKNSIHLALSLVRLMNGTLTRMGTYIKELEKQKLEIKALYGISLLHKNAKRFGFNTIDLPNNWLGRWKRYYLILLLNIFNLEKESEIRKKHDLSLKIIAVSKKSFEQFIGNY